MTKITRLSIGLTMLGAAWALGAASPAQARLMTVGPWCAVYYFPSSPEYDCHFASIEDCRPNILAGNRGSCVQNPYWVEGSPRRQRRAYR